VRRRRAGSDRRPRRARRHARGRLRRLPAARVREHPLHGCRHSIAGALTFELVEFEIAGGPPAETLRRGDASSDNPIDLGDAVLALDWLFRGGAEPPCLDAADADDKGGALPQLTDAVEVLDWLLRGGRMPRPPSPSTASYARQDCGPDPEDPLDTMGCRAFPPCS
jgi:hypothetical protein